jgi:hypothetical protein
MNKKLIIAGVAILIIVLLFIFTYRGKPVATQPQNNTTFPMGGTGTSSQNSTTLGVVLTDGSRVQVPDFTKQNQPAYANATDGYVAAGSVNGDFSIEYFPDGSYFDILLNKEPLGETRKKAEAALRAQLNLTNAQLCKLNTQVVTTRDVNEQFAGSNLGLSFCPGAATLPQ